MASLFAQAAAVEKHGGLYAGQPRRRRSGGLWRRSGDFVEAILPPATLLIIGAGHVGKALLQLGKWLGLRVVFCDDRGELCNPQAAPGADEYLSVPLTELPNHFAFTAQTYIVMPTREMRVDVEGYRRSWRSPTPTWG